MKMRLIYCLSLMAIILSAEVRAKLWKLEPKEDVIQKLEPKEDVIQETKVPEAETVKEPVVPKVPVTEEVKPKTIPSCPKSSNYETTVLKQFIGKLLNQFQPVLIPGENEEKVEYNMKMKLSSLDLNRVSLYLNQNGDIYEVEEVLTSMLGEVSADQVLLSNLSETFYEKLSGYVIICAPVLFILFLFLSLRFMHLPFWVLVKWNLFMVFAVSVIWNWYFLYQENYTKYTTTIEKGPPAECKEDYKAGFFESLSSSFLEIFHVPVDKCEKYHLITSIPPGLRVPPTEAISFCIVNTLLKPLASVGENIGLFFQKLSQQIPIPLLMIVIVFILIVLLFVIVVSSGYSIGGLLIQLTPPPTTQPTTLQPTPSPQINDSKEIKAKLDQVVKILEKLPNIDDDVKEIREVLQKTMKRALELKPIANNLAGSGEALGEQEYIPLVPANKPELKDIANNPAGFGDGHGDEAGNQAVD